MSKIMTRNPIFVTSDTLGIEALQKMVQGEFKYLQMLLWICFIVLTTRYLHSGYCLYGFLLRNFYARRTVEF